MKITQEADYALRIIQYLSETEENHIGAPVIADTQQVPLRFALKILRKLNTAGITKSYRGVSGGYSLSKHPSEISYKQVIEAVDGDIYINKCLKDNDNCTRKQAETCIIHKKLTKIQLVIDKELSNLNFGS